MAGNKEDDAFLVAELGKRGQRVLKKFREIADSEVSDPTLQKCLQFVKLYWQDNFRPALASLSCEVVGGKAEAADDVSLMITLASAGGGIHDDIIDKSLNKHFRMTVLGLYGPEYALIVGDLLIIKGWTMAYELVSKLCPEKLSQIIKIFGKWNLDVCEAEFTEISCRKSLKTDIGHYEKVMQQSIADAEACSRLGAIMGNGSEEQVQALAEFGSCLGFMYRLAGDAKDMINSEGNLADRLQNESVPLPLLYAAKSSKEAYDEIEAIIVKPRITARDLVRLQKISIKSGGLDYLLERSEMNLKEAHKKLMAFRDSEARQILGLMVDKSYSNISDLFR